MNEAQRNSSVEGHGVAVFGAGSGIGRGAAQLLAERGAVVGCVDIDTTSTNAVVEEIIEAGGTALGITADVRDASSVDDALGAIEAETGQLHAVVNSAGITGPLGIRSHEVDLDAFDATYQINLRGSLIVSQKAITRMLPNEYGRIVHVASIAGKEGNPGMVSYSATKAGLIGMIKSQGKEYANDGITINALAPAVIGTPFIVNQPTEILDYMIARIPMGRVGLIAEAAEILAWIVSPECSFTTGFTFDLSGGRATY